MNVIQLKPTSNQIMMNELYDEWMHHKRNLSFQRFISERMPIYFGPLASNGHLFDKIKSAERNLNHKFTIIKTEEYWFGEITVENSILRTPIFPVEDDLRIFMILFTLKSRVTKKPA